MYRYDEFDHKLVQERVQQFRHQVKRRLSGELTEDQFKPLRLMNGLYLQLHAYMLRVNVPYGAMTSRQMRKFAHVARTYDRGFGHFTTRQNIQYNWVKLEETPNLLAELAEVEVTGIQSSGIAYVILLQTIMLAESKMSWLIHESTASFCVNIPYSIRSSLFCRENSKLQ